MDREEKLKTAVKKTMEENSDLLKKLDDRDANGIPYWETKEFHDKMFESQQSFEE
jgi:hypothetical protein